MASMIFTDYSSSTTSRLIHFNHRNGAFLPRRCVGQLCLRTTASGRGRIRSSADAAIVIDERAVACNIMAEVKTEVSRMNKLIGAVPVLAVILIGDTKYSSAAYVVPCGFVGIKALVVRLPEDTSEEEVLKSVSGFNDDPYVHGILVELPLPSHMYEQSILNAVSVEKDVDGREPLSVPRRPKGCIELLHRYNFEIKGKRAVVIGRSNLKLE